jgi:hypothetical protein
MKGEVHAKTQPLLYSQKLQADGYYYVDLIEKRGEGVVF